MAVADLVRDGIRILRHDGMIPTLRAGLRVLNLNYQGYWWYLGYVYRDRLCRDCRTTEPFDVIEVPTDQITNSVAHRLDRWDDLGAVLEGDWDRTERTLYDQTKYRSVVDRFENGTPWEETDIYREAIDRIENGDSHWNGSLTIEDIDQRTRHVEQLYERIRNEGYKSQEERYGKPLRDIVLDRRFDRSMEEIAVAIGRDGEVLFIDGNHRLALAHVLELESIPVHVVARHAQWEDVRTAIRNARSLEALEEQYHQYLEHPDIRPVVSWSKDG